MLWTILFLVLLTRPLYGQTNENNLVEPEVNFKELEKWTEEYKDWRKWIARHGNRVVRSGFTGLPTGRKIAPEPPSWLADTCANTEMLEVRISEACELLSEFYKGAPFIINQSKVQAVQAKNEDIHKTSFLRFVHFDGLWTIASFNNRLKQSPLGIVGMHLAIPVPGQNRLQIFLPPGFMLFTMRYGRERKLMPGGTVGVGIRLFDFNFFDTGKRASANLNFAKAWIAVDNGFKSEISVFGLSFNFKD